MTEKLLFQFENSKGELLSIWYCEKIAQSTAFSKFQKLYLEIIDSGFAGSIHWDVITSKLDRIETVYTTMPDGETIQLIAFEHNRQLNEGFITFAGMDPAHRKHAFEKSRLLQFRFFKNILKSRGVSRVVAWVNIDNVKAIKLNERRGFVQETIQMVKKI